METTTYVVQHFRKRDNKWVDASEHTDKDEAEAQLVVFDEKLEFALGAFRLIRRTEQVI